MCGMQTEASRSPHMLQAPEHLQDLLRGAPHGGVPPPLARSGAGARQTGHREAFDGYGRKRDVQETTGMGRPSPQGIPVQDRE